jgi:hypothetical protein
VSHASFDSARQQLVSGISQPQLMQHMLQYISSVKIFQRIVLLSIENDLSHGDYRVNVKILLLFWRFRFNAI